jgi:hypothetical protein
MAERQTQPHQAHQTHGVKEFQAKLVFLREVRSMGLGWGGRGDFAVAAFFLVGSCLRQPEARRRTLDAPVAVRQGFSEMRKPLFLLCERCWSRSPFQIPDMRHSEA